MNDRGHLPADTLDLLLLEALERTEANAARAHLGHCATCAANYKQLVDDKQRFDQFVYPRTQAHVAAATARGSWLRWLSPRFLVPAFALASAGVVALVVTSRPTQTEDEVYVGVKGVRAPAVEVYAQRQGGAPFVVKPGGALKPHDRIRFVLSGTDARHALIASVDGKGAFSVYHPFDGQESAALAGAAKRHELPDSVDLDETLGRETLYAVLSAMPVDRKAVEAAIRTAPEKPLVPGATVLTFTFVKEGP